MTQQAGRAGRDKLTNKPSFSITVCFNSPAEQYLWTHPKSLLTHNKLRPSSLPITPSLIQGHLLCAAEESPLTGTFPASLVYGASISCLQTDHLLFGGDTVYDDALDKLQRKGSLVISPFVHTNASEFSVYRAHSVGFSNTVTHLYFHLILIPAVARIILSQ